MDSKKELYIQINASCSETDFDIAKVVYLMYKNKYIYTCVNRENVWYKFTNSHWIVCDNAHILLRLKMSTEVAQTYIDVAAELNSVDVRKKKMLDISLRLKNNAYKDIILKECCDLFYVQDFRKHISDM